MAIPFHSPERPTLANGAPAYPYWKPKAALPAIRVMPEKNGWCLSLWLIVNEEHTAAEFRKYIPFEGNETNQALSIFTVLWHYLEDPERVMKEIFGWPGIKEKSAELKPPKTPIPSEVKAEFDFGKIDVGEDLGF
jgi:hypothetical protein